MSLSNSLTAALLASAALLAPAASLGAGDDPVDVCGQRLQAIHRALIAYEREHHQWPDHLSDLVPKYLPNRESLLDPADPRTGDLGSTEAHADPRFHVSYSYERTVDPSNGLAQPLGRFPAPDLPGAMWGSWRLVNGRMEYFFGDQVPLVRCYHHRPPEVEREPSRDCVLNLTPSGRIYRSDFDWRRHADSLDYLLRTLDRDFTQGPGHVLREWLIWRLSEFLDSDESFDPAKTGLVASSVASQLLDRHKELKGEERNSCRLAALLYFHSQEPERALAALDAAQHIEGSELATILDDQIRAQAYHAAGRFNSEISTYQSLLKRRPEVGPYMEGLAAALEAAGQPDQARQWRDKADPGRLLVGHSAPEFEITLFDGSKISLEKLRRDRKAVLVSFWFCGCYPCRLEFPCLQEHYQSLHSRGLEIIAINHGDSRDQIAAFLKTNKVSFPIGMGADANEETAIFKAYHVSVYPTSFLIDQTGNVVWRGVGYGPDARGQLARELAKLGLEP